MRTVIELLDEVKKAKSVKTDYALAKELDLHRGLISDYYSGKRTPDEYACLQIAKALNENYDSISAAVRLMAEKNEKRREVWAEYYKSIQRIAAALLMTFAFFATFIVADKAKAANNSTTYIVNSLHPTNYAFFLRIFKKIVLAVQNMFSNAFARSCFSG